MEIGDTRLFRAETRVDYSGLRGSVYYFAKRSEQKFTATRVGNVVTVVRRADDFVPISVVLG